MKKLYSSFIALLCLLSVTTTKAQTEVTFYTNMGSFVVQLYDTITPITAGNFKTLVTNKFYDGLIFHRVIGNFIIQGGDPNGNGTGGPGYQIQDEFDTRARNVKQTISMANSGPNTGGSQFFFNLKNNPHLDYDQSPLTSKHAVFGIVTSNYTVVENIGMVQTDGNDKPLSDVVMDSVRITKAAASVGSVTRNGSINIYPNPTNNILNIDVPFNDATTVTITQLNGQIVYSNVTNNTAVHSVNVSHLSSGLYIVHLANTKGTYQGKLVIQ